MLIVGQLDDDPQQPQSGKGWMGKESEGLDGGGVQLISHGRGRSIV